MRQIICVFCLVLFFVPAVMAGAQSFSVAATPQTVTIYPGQRNVPVTVSVSSSSYTGPVTLALSGLPSGITVSPASLTLVPGQSGTLNLSAGLNADQEGFPSNANSRRTDTPNTVQVVGAVGSVTVASNFTLTVSISNTSFVPTQVDLPVVNINTGGVVINSKTVDVPGTITITSASGSTSYLPNGNDSDNTATFHEHGNSTSNMPKLAYKVKLNTSLDLLATMGLACPYKKSACDKSKSFILLANYDDKTLLRDWSASALANAIPYGAPYLDETPVPAGYKGSIPSPDGKTHMPWAPHSLFVELYINGIYEGNYQLIEEVKVDSHRVNITELGETDTTDDITGGYLMEIDRRQEEAFNFVTPHGVDIGLIDPDFSPDPEVPEQTSYISDYVNQAEAALYASNFTDPVSGWRAYFDEASAVNFYLVNDIMGNVDGGDFFSSNYLYKDVDNPFLYMGPIWDFDISSGNTNFAAITNPTVPWMQEQAPWYHQWFQDPGFKADVITQFNTLKNKGVFNTWIASISQQAATLKLSQANNFSRWPILGLMVWPNPEAAGSYDGEVAYFTNWLKLRIAYLDSIFNGKAQTATALDPPTGAAKLGTPETLVAHVTGNQKPAGNVSFFSNSVLLGAAALDGGGTATLTTNNLLSGTNNLQAVYNGDAQNGLSSSGVTTVAVAAPVASTSTSLATAASSIASGDSAHLTVSVTGSSGSTAPSGTVTFTMNGATIGSARLTAAGTASLATTALGLGSYSLQAAYSGDSNYAASTSNTITVAVQTPGFTADVTPGSQSVARGKSVLAQVTISPVGGFHQAVKLACQGLPVNASCDFSPETVTLDGSNPATSTLTITTRGAASAQNHAAGLREVSAVALLSGVAGFGLLFGTRRKYRWYLQCIPLALLAGAAILMAGCGSSAMSAASGNYAITVTATSGSTVNTTMLFLSIE